MRVTPPLHARRALLLALAGTAVGIAPPARACEFFSSHLRIWHPWTRATRVDADSAIVCMRFDEVQRSDRLIAVQTPIAASARLAGPGVPADHEGIDLLIPAGQELTLTEDTRYVELLDLQQPLQIGRSFELRLVFEQAGTVNALLNVDYPGLR